MSCPFLLPTFTSSRNILLRLSFDSHLIASVNRNHTQLQPQERLDSTAIMFRWLHYIGVAFLFLAAILLLVTTISSPVIGDIGVSSTKTPNISRHSLTSSQILKVMLTNQTDIRHSSITFGSFGHCVLDVPPVQTDQDYCFPKAIGYKPAVIMSEIDHTIFNRADTATIDGLTYVYR